MKQLRLKDNSTYDKDHFADIPCLTAKINNKTLEQLEREGIFVFPEFVADSEDITSDQMVLQQSGDSFRTQNIWALSDMATNGLS